ncbi:hypothetical protein D3C73_940310 [compost metagenome]
MHGTIPVTHPQRRLQVGTDGLRREHSRVRTVTVIGPVATGFQRSMRYRDGICSQGVRYTGYGVVIQVLQRHRDRYLIPGYIITFIHHYGRVGPVRVGGGDSVRC